ncbi:hypothetical protein ACQKIE_04715 [Luteibacter sp. NPDC031894]|uniref:ApeA N-terminal domain 1-containing protein n=1 Tax=Luteibacter sp. NPDC031894 TaxID=3390572 RepID=UPI003D011755
MKKTDERLQLGKSYQFGVVVKDNGTSFAGNLSLSPEGCSLVVRGDAFEGRTSTLDWYEIDELQCTSFEGTFVLRGLTGMGGSSRTLERHPLAINHFEIQYAVAQVIFGRGHIASPNKYRGFEISSPSIAQWIGSTTTQHRIVAASERNTLFSDDAPPNAEFEVDVPGVGNMSVTYQLSMGYLKDFSVGVHFPPVVSVIFDASKSAAETISTIQEIETLLSFLFGYPLAAEQIHLITRDRGFNLSSLYVARKDQDIVGAEHRYPLFPLGHNLSYDQLGLPPLPIEVFPNYLGLPDGSRAFLKKYLRYRQLANPEERFLGFFRLLEKLCYQSESFLPTEPLQNLLNRATPFLVRHFNDKKNVTSLLKRMYRLNQFKLDTAGCIRRFMVDMPAATLKLWRYGPDDLQAICKLRNDLTHANELEPDTDDIETKAKFIEVLLVVRLLVHVGVSLANASAISARLYRHNLIEKPVETPLTEMG